MKYVNLGRSGLKVSRLCLGCMSYGEPERLPQPWSLDEKASRPLIRQALEAGINFFDTANIYSGGSSEEITGKALREMARRDEIVVATKTFFPWRNSPNTGFLSRKAILLLPALPKSTRCQELMLQLPGCYQNPSSQHRSLAQRNQNIFPRLSARWTFHLAMPKSRNWKLAICRTPLTGSFPRFRIRRLTSRRLQRSRTINTLPWPGVAGSPRPLIPGH